MWSSPVTFGGGIAIEKFSSGVPVASGWKMPASSHSDEHPRLDLVRVVAGAVLQLREAVFRHARSLFRGPPGVSDTPSVADVALVLWGLYGVLAVVLPIALQVRRTGTTGLKGVSGKPGSHRMARRCRARGRDRPRCHGGGARRVGRCRTRRRTRSAGVHASGVVLYAVGLATIVFSQQWMGRSWRIGVDERERTRLVTGGPFTLVRNPIFTGMILTSAGLALMVPSVLSFAAVALLIASLEVQTRLVEEPYLTRVHGDEYTGWASRAGRFLPGVGRLG